MKTPAIRVVASFGLIAAVFFAPCAASAQRVASGPGMGGGHPMGGGHGMGGGHRIGGTPFAPRPFGPHGFAHGGTSHHFGHRHFARGFTSPYFAYASPYLYGGFGGYDSPSYYDPPAASMPSYYTRSIALAPAPPVPPPPAAPEVIQYQTGRYELRGDGTAAPYRWVWIPNPPSSPPPAPPSPGSADPSPAKRQELYRWTDEEGVLHLTDRLEIVPPQYRGRGKPS
jgi:hypothetical protein